MKAAASNEPHLGDEIRIADSRPVDIKTSAGSIQRADPE
jgi:hypothetical protein